jgi:hypothetical protein
MRRRWTVGIYIVALVAVVVCVDALFLRHLFWERLLANTGIVLLFAAFSLKFLKHRYMTKTRARPLAEPR